ncbi:MAG TPA: aldolase [Patescibacteria group bacterium]|nr:aldolase [Patescibacteria group bacterium]
MFFSLSSDVKTPVAVPSGMQKRYIENFMTVTQNTGRLMLFAGDQKVEHLNDDFYGKDISLEDNNPEHLFKIASKARIGAFATQLGLISHYGMDYPKIPYIVKLNAKTNLVKTTQADPQSSQWISVEQVMEFKKNSKLNIVGVGYTVYVGSEYESDMLSQAATLIQQAHRYGLLTILWMYPRGKAVAEEKDPHIIAGAAGIGATLGADFVKVNYPKTPNPAEALKEAVQAAGRTKLICAGGASEEVEKFLSTLHDQIHISGTAGNATGRNIHQKPLQEAIRFCNAIAAITFDNKSVEQALQIYHG